MKSRAHFKSHPIHPMLIGFPIAFFIGGFVSDLLALFVANDGLTQMARYLIIAGIVTALLAAVPGFIDYLYTVPPKSSAKNKAAKHGALNLFIVVLFTVALWLRGDVDQLAITILEFTGVGLLSISGWLGGTLVYRNQIGVDIRYADAGKWNEATVTGSGKVNVGKASELNNNQMKLLRINGKRIVLANSDGDFVAFEDHCPHRGGSLAGGALICGQVQCPWHGSQFDVRTGKLNAGPSETGIAVFKVHRQGDDLFLEL